MGDEPEKKEEPAVFAEPEPEPAKAAEPEAAIPPQVEMAAPPEAAATSASHIPAGMPVPSDDPREATARWARISILVFVLLLVVGLVWRHYQNAPVPHADVERARADASIEWAELSRCLVGDPLARGETASGRMRRIWLGLSREEQRAAHTSGEVWPSRCLAPARALASTLRPVRRSSPALNDLTAVTLGVAVALQDHEMPRSVDALFSSASAAHLPPPGPVHADDAPPPLDVPTVAALLAVSIEGANLRVEDLDDHRVLLRGERAVLCTVDDQDQRVTCAVVPGDGGHVAGLGLVRGTGQRSLGIARLPAGRAIVVDLATGATVTTDELENVEARGDALLLVHGKMPGAHALQTFGAAGPTLALALPVGEALTAPPMLASPTDTLHGFAAWATRDRQQEVLLRVAETGTQADITLGVPHRVDVGVTGVALAVDACAAQDTRAVLLQLGRLPEPTSLALADGGAPPDAAAPVLAVSDGGVPDASQRHRSRVRPIAGREPYQPLPSDLPVERRVAIVLVGPDGTPTAASTTNVVSGDATFACEDGAAVVTVLGSAADRTGASDEPGQRPWRLREPGFRITQLRCTAAGCAVAEAELHGFRDVPEVVTDGGRVIVFYRPSDTGGLRARIGPIGWLADAADVVLADDVVHDGIDVRERRIGTGPRGALLVARTSAGVLAWRVGADGAPRLLAGTR